MKQSLCHIVITEYVLCLVDSIYVITKHINLYLLILVSKQSPIVTFLQQIKNFMFNFILYDVMQEKVGALFPEVVYS